MMWTCRSKAGLKTRFRGGGARSADRTLETRDSRTVLTGFDFAMERPRSRVIVGTESQAA